MDKFGIFNLLNSFFSLGNNQTAKTDGNSNLSSDLVGNLLSSFSGNKNQENKSEKSVSAPPMPLQNSMLSTINSHDAIVKRVKEKQGQNTRF